MAPFGVFVVASDGVTRFANPGWLKFIGQSEEQACQGLWLDPIVPEDRISAQEGWKSLSREGGWFECEVRLNRGTESPCWVDIWMFSVPPSLASEGHHVGIAVDVTSHRRAETAIREREQFLSAVFENIPLMVFVKDAKELRFLRFNKAAEALLGIDREAMYGKNDFDFFAREQAEFFVRKDREVLNNGELVDIPEEPIESRDKGQRFLHTKKIPILDDRGVPRYLLGISEDITERKKVEEELRHAKDAADAASRAKSVFLANMSHEIRTPLHAILGFSEVLHQDGSLREKQSQALKAIRSSGEHLLSLIDDVLEVSRIEAGRLTLRSEPFDLPGVLAQIESMFRPRIEARSLQFQVTCDADAPRWVIGDGDRLRQVLVNLLGNAVKFTSTGRIGLSMHGPKDTDADRRIQIEVADTGVGIPREELDRLFEPFEQTEEGRRVGGTGLGLALSRQYIGLMGGSIEVCSNPGQGSRFVVSVPLQLAPESDSQSSAAVPSPPRALNSGLEQSRILIVDDEPLNRSVIKILLEPVGLEFEEASDGEEAIEILGRYRPDVILMDLRMEPMDGLEATRRIKAIPELSAVPIVAVTAGAFEEDREAAFAAGANDFIRKPFRRDELLKVLVRHVAVKPT